ncbi:MAG: sigma-70 family RNA polymerase sigma factor [Myxococcota bacterium]
MSRYLEGDHVAFAGLYRRYKATLHRIAAAIVRSSSEAEDIVQETMLYVARSGHVRARWTHPYSVESWLKVQVRSRSLDHLRKSSRYESHLKTYAGTAASVDLPRADWLTVSVLRELAALTPSQRDALLAMAFAGWSRREWSKCESLSEGRVVRLIGTARKRLRERLFCERRLARPIR